MTNDDHKQWSEQHGRYIYRDQDGNWMIDEFGPTDDFSLARQLRRIQDNLRSERSSLNPKGPVPSDDEGRFRASLANDKDALQAGQIDEQIDNLEWMIQEELEREQDRFQKSKIGKVGAIESKAVRQEKKQQRHTIWIEQAKKKQKNNRELRPWTIAGMIADAYTEAGSAKSYGQRAIFDVIKVLDCFQKKKS